jgi:hypothetical protein
MPDHSYYEELTALAAGGHLSDSESEELRAHLAECAACREDAHAYGNIAGSGLPLLRDTGAGPTAVTREPAAGARERFLARAESIGARFSADVHETAPVQRRRFGPQAIAGLALAAAVVMAVWSVTQLRSVTGAQQQVETLTRDVERLGEQLTARDQQLATQQEQLNKLQASLDAAGAAVTRAGASDVPGFRLGQSASLEARLLEEIRNRDQQLAAVSEELSRINQLRVTDRTELEAQGVRLRAAFDQLRIATATIEMERQMATAGRDILALMLAKQLRVVDVRDMDAAGQPGAAFARMFITEGRSIRIFAFDMNEGGGAPAQRYQVWAERVGDPKSVRSLGVLNVDDRTQNRWTLSIDDADFVKTINSVFVTASSRGGAPEGPRLLYAFLGQSSGF